MDIMHLLDFLPAHTGDVLSGIGQVFMGLGIFGSMLLSWRNGVKIEEVHKATNSMKDELVIATRKEGEFKGREDARREAEELNNGKNK